MEENGIERLYRSRKILKGGKVRVSTGSDSNHVESFSLDRKEGKMHAVICNVSVEQENDRNDLDIQFYAVDDENYHKWLTNSPHTALVIAPRIISASILFSVQGSGTYHIILDNKHSTFTDKYVSFDVYEIWTEEREIVDNITEVEEESVQKETETTVAEKKGTRSRLFSWFDRLKQRKISLAIFLFLACMLISTSAFIGMVIMISILLNIKHEEVMRSVGNSCVLFVLGGLMLFALFYKTATGENIPLVKAPSLEP